MLVILPNFLPNFLPNSLQPTTFISLHNKENKVERGFCPYYILLFFIFLVIILCFNMKKIFVCTERMERERERERKRESKKDGNRIIYRSESLFKSLFTVALMD